MPLYDYRCSECELDFSEVTSVARRDSMKCPECGKKKCVSRSGVYETSMGVDMKLTPDANYEKMSALVQAKIQELRNVYKANAAKDGLKGKDALHSDHYKLFRKQSNDLKIMLSTAMSMMTKAAGATGQVIKPNVTPGYTAKILGKGN